MSKKTTIIIIAIVITAALLGVLTYVFLLKPSRTNTPENTGTNPFPYGDPQLTQTNPLGTGAGTINGGIQNPDGSTGTIINPDGTTTGNNSGSINGGTNSGSGTGQSDPRGSSTSTTNGGSGTAPEETATPNPGTPIEPTATGAVLDTLIGNRPTASTISGGTSPATSMNCYSPAGNTCFNKIEAAMYFAEKEIAEIDKIITLFRGNASVVSMNNLLMELDHCIPGPDYGFASRANSLLEGNKEWQDIVGDTIGDQYKQNGVRLELTGVINNFQLESNVKAKNIPMAQAGLAFVNATPKYNDIAREYRDRKTARSRALITLENLYADWNLAKSGTLSQAQSEALKQQVTVKFSQMNESLPTYETYVEAFTEYETLLDDAEAVTNLTNTCRQERVALAGSFTQYQTYLGTSFKQNILDINYADDQKKLFCSIDPAQVNQLDSGISCRTTGGLGGNGDPQLRVNFTSGDWDDCLATRNAGNGSEYNSDNEYAHPNILQYLTNPITNQTAVRFGRGPRTTLRALLQQSNPEMTINRVIDDAVGTDAGVGEVQIDDEGTLYAHSLYSFGITCEKTYTSSRYDYIDELTLYGY